MAVVADESVDYGIINASNFKVVAIVDISPGIDDADVLNIANSSNALLITEDKDFGELVHRLQLPHKGVLLIRLSALKRNERIKYL